MTTQYFTLPSGYVEARPCPSWEAPGQSLAGLSDSALMAHYKARATETALTFLLATQQNHLSEADRREALQALEACRTGKAGARKALEAQRRALTDRVMVYTLAEPFTYAVERLAAESAPDLAAA